MVISGVVLYFYTKALLQNEIEEELFSNKDRVERLLQVNPDLVGIPPIIMAERTTVPQKTVLIDTLIYDPLQDEVELFRQLSGTKNLNGQEYKITVRTMVIESEDILSAIVFTFLSIIILAFLFLFYLNKSRNQRLWKPFFTILERLKTFSVKSDALIVLEPSTIVEFDDLNREISALATQVRADYRNLKQFTEDVSHEMQTPLAIMQARIDTILGDVAITQPQFEHLSQLQQDIQRLKRLNRKLILLAKIDNDQFRGAKILSINKVIGAVIANFQELYPVEIRMVDNGDLHYVMDASLASILFTNLLSNAIKHGQKNKPIVVQILETSVDISNVGRAALQRPEEIFDRFYTESRRKDSTGLGLSIVKKICDYYGLAPSYRFRENNTSSNASKHVFKIDFKV